MNNDDFRNFSINQATGELNFLSSPKNYEEPTDIGKDNIYEIVVFAESGGNLIVSQEVDIQVLNTNDAPTLDRVGSSTIIVKENFSLALAFNSTDEDHNISYPDIVYVVDGQELRYQKHTVKQLVLTQLVHRCMVLMMLVPNL